MLNVFWYKQKSETERFWQYANVLLLITCGLFHNVQLFISLTSI